MKLLATKKVEENVYELEIRVEAEEFKAACEKSYKKNASKLNIPGFRKGKAPKAMVLKMVGEEYFFDDAINDTYPAAYEAALEESKLEPVDKADVELADVSAEGYTFKAKVTVRSLKMVRVTDTQTETPVVTTTTTEKAPEEDTTTTTSAVDGTTTEKQDAATTTTTAKTTANSTTQTTQSQEETKGGFPVWGILLIAAGVVAVAAVVVFVILKKKK